MIRGSRGDSVSNETEEVYGDDEDPIPLKDRADVRRYLAKCLRRIAKGTLNTSQGHCLVIGLGTLAKIMIEDESTDIAKRLKVVEERQAAH